MAALKMIERLGGVEYEKRLAYNRAYRKANLSQSNKWAREKNQRVKAKCFALYGGLCQRCEFGDIRALQIDHINGVPNGERRLKNNPHRGGVKLYQAILSEVYPQEDFQLLCANCNWIKRFEDNETNHINYREEK